MSKCTYDETGCGDCELTIKADKYRRHDLRKNPEDLPKGHTDCLIWIKTLNNIRARVAFYNGKEFILHRNQNQSQVLAWKYIEPFDEVEE